MFAFLFALVLILVPAPSIPDNPPIGVWTIAWGRCHQVTTFRPDGSCESPQFGKGHWSIGQGGEICFGERDDKMQYVMKIDWDVGLGDGARVDEDGFSGNVTVKIKRAVQ